MKLVRRLTIYLLVAVTGVLAIDTWASVRSHLALFDADMRRDEELLGRTLASAVERVWRSEGEAAAREVLASVNASNAEMRAELVSVPAAGSPGDERRAAIARAQREGVPVHLALPGGSVRRLHTYVPLKLGTAEARALEISESFAHERGYALARIRQTLATTLATLLACGAVAWLVGVRVVGRPVEALVAKARRIAHGDFEAPLVLRPETELALLAREMNEMAASLAAASREVAEQSAARIAAQEQLRHADRLTTVGKLASGLAHELGTPLNVVAGRAKMIASGEIANAAEGEECARIIVAQADRMTAIVRQLLDFARRRSGEKQPLDLAVLARQTAGLLEPLGAKRGVRVSCDAAEAGVVARADAAQIQQALMNLVMNAIHASARGSGVSIAVRKEHAAAAPGRARGLGPSALIEVSDTGAGMAPEVLEQVFDPFFTTKAPGEGTGLGLSVAYGIAEDHGGWIDAESASQQGSRFRIWLPLELA